MILDVERLARWSSRCISCNCADDSDFNERSSQNRIKIDDGQSDARLRYFFLFFSSLFFFFFFSVVNVRGSFAMTD